MSRFLQQGRDSDTLTKLRAELQQAIKEFQVRLFSPMFCLENDTTSHTSSGKNTDPTTFRLPQFFQSHQ
jgi:hypothetical protein